MLGRRSLPEIFFGPTRRGDYRFLEKLLRKCERKPVFRTLGGSVVICEPASARRVLSDGDGVLEHAPAFWRSAGQPLSPPLRGELNRWVHGVLLEHDAGHAADIAVEHLLRAAGDLHRACLLAVVASCAELLRIEDDDALAATVRAFVSDEFHAVIVGPRRDRDESRIHRLAARAADLLRAHQGALPQVFVDDQPGVDRGELYLRTVVAFVGASATMMAWLVCALHDDELAGVDLSGAARARLSDQSPEHVALELLRLWPPAWQHRRQVLADHRIGRLSVLSGDDIVVPVFALHRLRNEWANPTAFDPRRWWDAPRPAAFLPFAIGPGTCVGAQYELRWLAALAARLDPLRSLTLQRQAASPCVTAVFSPPLHALGHG